MIVIKKNGQVVRADGKDLREVVVIVSASSSSEVITGKEVPVLTDEQFTQAYNYIVDGKVVYIASENDEIFIVKQANEESGNPVIYFDYYNSHILRYELAEEEVEITAKEYGGVGAVVSVNGKAGVVVLNASDLLATNAQTIQQNLERIDELIDDANSDIEDLQDEVATVRDIAQAKTNSYVVSLLADITGTQDEDGNFTSVSAITGVDLSTLKIGDNIFVKDTEAPDFWVSAITPVVKLNKLQTEKIDIENYYTKEEVDELLEDKADVVDVSRLSAKTELKARVFYFDTDPIADIKADLGKLLFPGKAYLVENDGTKTEITNDVLTSNRYDNVIGELLDTTEAKVSWNLATYGWYAVSKYKETLNNAYYFRACGAPTTANENINALFVSRTKGIPSRFVSWFPRTLGGAYFYFEVINVPEPDLSSKQDKTTVRQITTATYNGGISSNELTDCTQAMTSLTIASLAVATGDNTPTFAIHFKLAEGGTVSFTPTIKWDCGNPQFVAGVDYLVVITKVGSQYFGALGEHY